MFLGGKSLEGIDGWRRSVTVFLEDGDLVGVFALAVFESLGAGAFVILFTDLTAGNTFFVGVAFLVVMADSALGFFHVL